MFLCIFSKNVTKIKLILSWFYFHILHQKLVENSIPLMKSSWLISHISCLIYLSYLQSCINYSRLCIIMISTCHLAAGGLPVNTLLLRGRLLLRRGLPGVVLPHLRCRDVHGHASRVTCHECAGPRSGHDWAAAPRPAPRWWHPRTIHCGAARDTHPSV